MGNLDDQFLAQRQNYHSSEADRAYDSVARNIGQPSTEQAPQTQQLPTSNTNSAPPIPPQQIPQQKKTVGQTIYDTWLSVGQDIARGVGLNYDNQSGTVKTDFALPKAVVGGASDAINNLYKFAQDIGHIAARKMGSDEIYVSFFDKNNKFDPSIISREEYANMKMAGFPDVIRLVPSPGQPNSVTGQIVRVGTNFILGSGGKSMAGMPSALRYAVGASTLDPQQERLSNIIDKVAPNWLTNFLKADPSEDGQMISYFKSIAENTGLALAVDGIVKGAMFLKQRYLANGAGEPPLPGGGGAGETPPPGGGGAGETPPPGGAMAVAPAEESVAPAVGDVPPPGMGAPAEGGATDSVEGVSPPPVDATSGSVGGATEAKATSAVTDIFASLPKDDLEAQFDAEAAASKDAATGEGMPEAPQPAVEPSKPLDPIKPGQEPLIIPDSVHENADVYYMRQKGQMDSPLTAPTKDEIRVNLNTISGAAWLRDLTAQISQVISPKVLISDADVIAAARSQHMTTDEFLAIGNNAELASKMAYIKMTYNSTSKQTWELSLKAIESGASEDYNQFIASLNMSKIVLDAQENMASSLARAIRFKGVPVLEETSREDWAKGVLIKKFLAEAGGDMKMVARMVAAAESNGEVAAMIADMQKMHLDDWIKYGIYNSYLGPKVLIKKVSTDTFMLGWNYVNIRVAEIGNEYASWAGFGRPPTRPDVLPLIQGEAAAYAKGVKNAFFNSESMPKKIIPDNIMELGASLNQVWGAFKDGVAVQTMRRAFQAGRGQIGMGRAYIEGLEPGDHIPTTTPEHEMARMMGWESPGELSTPDSAAFKYLKNVATTTYIGVVDDTYGLAQYRGNLQQIAWRKVINDGVPQDSVGTAMQELMRPENMPISIHYQAKNFSKTQLFKSQLGELAQHFENAADYTFITPGGFRIPIGRMVAPFVRIPLNFVKFPFANSPIALLDRNSALTKALQAGGAERDLALARMYMATTLTAGFSLLSLTGHLTGSGPSDPIQNAAWRGAGNKPFSFTPIGGGEPYSYDALEPLGMQIALIANSFDILKYGSPDNGPAAAASLIPGIAQAAMEKSYFQSLHNLLQSIDDPSKEGAWWIRSSVAPLMPGAEGTLKAFRDGLDPWARQHQNMIDAWWSRVPGLSGGIANQIDGYGRDVPLEAGFPKLFGPVSTALSPVRMGTGLTPPPISKWIWEHQVDFPSQRFTIHPPGPNVIFQGGANVSAHVQLSDIALMAYQRLAGNAYKDESTGLGMADYLNSLLAGKNPNASTQEMWDKGNNAERAIVVQGIVANFREAAKKAMIDPSSRYYIPDIHQAVQAQWALRMQQLQAQQQQPAMTQ